MLYCKPQPGTTTIAELNFSEKEKISLRSLDIKNDPGVILRWLHPSISKEGIAALMHLKREEYKALTINSDSHCFIAAIDDLLIARIKCYKLETNELGKYIQARNNDLLAEILVAPNVRPVPGLSQSIWFLFLAYIFRFEKSDRVYVTLDMDDHENGRVLLETGLRFIENTVISNGVISLYLMTKTCFNASKSGNPR